MPAELTMPQLSDTMTEGTLIKWHRKEGDKVKAGDEIADVETDKATMPMEALDSGTIAYIAAPEGAKVPTGGLLAVLATGSEKPEEVKIKYAGAKQASAKAPAASGPPAAAEKRPAQPAASQAAGQAARPTRIPPAASGGAAATLEQASNSEVHEPSEIGHGATREKPTAVPSLRHAGNGESRIHASPLARRIAADQHIDLSRIAGSGPNGRIVQRDVLEARSGAGKSPVAPAPAGPGPGKTEVVALTKMRSAIAAALQRSKQNVPHFYEAVDVDMEEVNRLREWLNKRLDAQKVRVSIADFIHKAVAIALQQNPALNARFNSEKGEVTRYGDVNLGIAVAIPDGLIVPVLRQLDRLSVPEIRARSVDLIDRARAQRLKREELSEATFTVSSLGSAGIREFSAIINPPEVGILAVGAAEQRAVVRNGQIAARSTMTLTLSCDHRVVDGAVAAEFLKSLKGTLEEPWLLAN